MKIQNGKYRLAKDVQTGCSQPQILRAGQVVSVTVNRWENGQEHVTVTGWCDETQQERSASVGFVSIKAGTYLLPLI